MKNVVPSLFALHFLAVIAYLSLSVMDIEEQPKLLDSYMNPYFTQNWSMFSKPPTFNLILYYQFMEVNEEQDTVITGWYNMNKSLNKYNENNYFSISQRMIKFKSSALNSLFLTLNASKCKIEGTTLEDNLCVISSPGYGALRNYARYFYSNNFNGKTTEGVNFKIKILQELFSDESNNENMAEENLYKEINVPFMPLNTINSRSLY